MPVRTEMTPQLRKKLEKKIREKWKHNPKRAEYECFRAICGMHTIRPRPTARRVSRCIGDWIERYCFIKTKGREIRPIKMNRAQRKFLASILRRWRVGKTAEIIVLKPRQTGFSTFSELVMLAMAVLFDNENCCVMGNKDEVSIKVKRIFRLALSRLPYRLPTRHNVGLLTEFDHPHNSILSATSSQATDPGHGDTLRGLHLTEVARWKEAEDASKGIMNTVPQEGRVVVIWESTANGAEGYFYKIYWDAVNNISDAIPLFIPWYEHEEYTVKHLSKREASDIAATLTDEEKELLEQSYFVRGKGWTKVSLEQLAWRRRTIADPKRCHNDLDAFHEQYPATADEAFLSTGRPVFNLKLLHQRLKKCVAPLFVGDIDDTELEYGFTPGKVAESMAADKYDEYIPYQDVTFEKKEAWQESTGQKMPVKPKETTDDSADKLRWPAWPEVAQQAGDSTLQPGEAP